MLKSIALIAVAALISTPALAQMAPAKPAPAVAKVAVAKKVTKTTTTTVARAPAKPRTAKSLQCSKDADGKNLHGAPRDKFMRACNAKA